MLLYTKSQAFHLIAKRMKLRFSLNFYYHNDNTNNTIEGRWVKGFSFLGIIF